VDGDIRLKFGKKPVKAGDWVQVRYTGVDGYGMVGEGVREGGRGMVDG
jgi:hypothetical protein